MRPASFRVRSDSWTVMYGSARPPAFMAGYHSETMSCLAFEPGSQGSGREVSVRCREVAPTGREPVGSGSESVTSRAVVGGSAEASGEGLREGRSVEVPPAPVAGVVAGAQEVVIVMTTSPAARVMRRMRSPFCGVRTTVKAGEVVARRPG
ncbi:hypothetical protein ACFQYP_16085 [Nonomuraea antimicrobica]